MTDCPICYESIPSNNINCLVTGCGHAFHTSCLLTHTSYNGYGCPCCRTPMSEELKPKDEDSDNEYDNRTNINYGANINLRPEPNNTDQYVLDGARWMFQRANNEMIDETDPFTDEFERWQAQMDLNNDVSEIEIDRKTTLVLRELDKIKAISYEDLVKGYLFWNQEHLYANSSKYEFNNRKVTSTLTSVLQKIT
jgi:hypothetical protein